MQYAKTFTLVVALAAILVSCQKEVGFDDRDPVNNPGGITTDAGSIIGDYDFVGMTASTKTTVSVTESGQSLKTITTSTYNSKNNSGTVKITAADFIGSNIAYDIDTTMKMVTYLNGMLMDEMEMPMMMSAPATSSTSPYVRNDGDSITISSSFMPMSGAPAAPTPTQVGMRLSWSGDTLVLKSNIAFNTTTDVGGTPGTLTGSATAVMRLKKKP